MIPSKAATGLSALALSAVILATTSPTSAKPPRELSLTPLGTYATGAFNEGASEIVSYDRRTERAFVVNAQAGSVDVLDISNPGEPAAIAKLETPGANSVDVHEGLVAVAVAEQAADPQQPGRVSFFRADSLRPVKTITVGALPDMVTFTPDGQYALVAGEGEPSGYEAGDVDPPGTVAVIDLRRGVGEAAVRLAGFTAYDGREDALRQKGIRIFGPGASASQDLEPEYVAVDRKSRTAYVTLQENNAFAVVDIRRARVERLLPLGLKDHSLPRNAMDADDTDLEADIEPHAVKGMYLSDGISAYTSKGKSYLVTANEGDAREYGGFAEETRIGALPNATTGLPPRLTVTSSSPRDRDGDEEPRSFGGRSISIRDTDGRLVWDSGDQLERLVLERDAANFNATNDENPSFDDRSDNKGPEPEGVDLGTIRGRTYAFVGLERASSIAILDITDPRRATVAGYATNRRGGAAEAGLAGDLGPEGIHFVPASDSPTGDPLLLVGNEVSGTTTVWEVGAAE